MSWAGQKEIERRVVGITSVSMCRPRRSGTRAAVLFDPRERSRAVPDDGPGQARPAKLSPNSVTCGFHELGNEIADAAEGAEQSVFRFRQHGLRSTHRLLLPWNGELQGARLGAPPTMDAGRSCAEGGRKGYALTGLGSTPAGQPGRARLALGRSYLPCNPFLGFAFSRLASSPSGTRGRNYQRWSAAYMLWTSRVARAKSRKPLCENHSDGLARSGHRDCLFLHRD